jgi:dTDP-4-amino-4,6-dideoxygalactose transaminase
VIQSRDGPAARRAVVAANERVPFVDLTFQWRQIAAEVMPDLARLFEASAFTLGPWVERFERAAAEYLKIPHAIGVNSGTSALHLSLIAAGVGQGDAVLVPANTFIATAWAALYVGATPILCDVDPDSWAISVADAQRRLTPAVKAIMPVHLYGQPAAMDEVCSFAARHDLAVIEDAAQAFGARIGGRPVGGRGLSGCFSFYPAKNLGAAGEAGLVVTYDAEIAERLRRLRHHSQIRRYIHEELGFNYRMEGVQALVLLHKLRRLDGWTEERRQIAQRYLSELAGLPLELPKVVNDDHVWHLFVVHTPERDRLRHHLSERGIETGLHYPVPLHRQPCFDRFDFDRNSFPIADRNAQQCLSLPIFVGMTAAQIDAVIAVIRDYFGASA